MIFKIICMVMAGVLSVYSAIQDNYKVMAYWLFVVAYWSSSIMGG